MCEIEKEIKRKLTYDKGSGNLYWTKVEERDRYDKRFNKLYAGKVAGSLGNSGYISIILKRKSLQAHRVCWFLHYGFWPEKTLDHINGVKSDNRIENLRDVVQDCNMKNLPKYNNNTTGVVGVSFYNNCQKYVATINVDGKRIHLGYHNSLEEATEARVRANKKYKFHENHGRG